ncbi:hypothetical protein CYLTODRAFT_378272 [Cylindrobasidium torrendii FP15055 ss-10]|uniref:Zn(2)-C6 fungal-type domain-containing protein n=1 Tax=Cylindrobasidium torrendii FP15055 ss-10 TaxID=1314674 RepID=A0A0D7B6G9_9AGAR|nr:hypothetical protein CYLTODRAFT_378272 [Cylindrobasidium torrendii FP15055 ss-10]
MAESIITRCLQSYSPPPMSPSSSSSSLTATSSARTHAAPYQRRPSGQPKSTRQQFSACGACRMRRVRCDLKDLSLPTSGPSPSCSNCQERGLKCIDEFADVKAVKLLRRGRRLQQVEAIYGKSTDGSASPQLASPATHLPSSIPQLKPEFFSSPFYRWFSIQRPVLDSSEFAARFTAHCNGDHQLGHEGSVLSLLLVVWAASYGVDECGGLMEDQGFDRSTSSSSLSDFAAPAPSVRSVSAPTTFKSSHKPGRHHSRSRAGRREAIEPMLREILELVDYHGMMRRPTWDGVRVLLLLLPLMEDASPADRLIMHEATMLQANALAQLAPEAPALSSGHSDSLLRARIFWYAHLQEGMFTAMRGGRLVLHDDDLDTFQTSIPPMGYNTPSGSPYLCSSQPFLALTHLFSIPLRLGAVCRRAHAVLTSSKVRRRVEEGSAVDGPGVQEVLDGLHRCWDEFEAAKRPTGMVTEADYQAERFSSAWQIFIFECYNRVREALKQLLSISQPTGTSSSPRPVFSSHSSPQGSPHGASPAPFYSLQQLYATSVRKTTQVLPYVLGIIKHHLTYELGDPAGIFRWDNGLTRDGCYFAGFLAASVEGASLMDPDTTPTSPFPKQEIDPSMESYGRAPVQSSYVPVVEPSEGFACSMRALAEMRWAFAKSDERRETLRGVWSERNMRELVAQPFNQPHTPPNALALDPHGMQVLDMHYAVSDGSQLGDVYTHTSPSTSGLLPPLTIASMASTSGGQSAPTTAYSTDGSSGWHSYTPPSTSATSASMHSPGFSTLGHGMPRKNDMYSTHHPTADMDQFNFHPPSHPSNMVATFPHSRTVSNGYMDYAGAHQTPLQADGTIEFVDRNGYYHRQ